MKAAVRGRGRRADGRRSDESAGVSSGSRTRASAPATRSVGAVTSSKSSDRRPCRQVRTTGAPGQSRHPVIRNSSTSAWVRLERRPESRPRRRVHRLEHVSGASVIHLQQQFRSARPRSSSCRMSASRSASSGALMISVQRLVGSSRIASATSTTAGPRTGAAAAGHRQPRQGQALHVLPVHHVHRRCSAAGGGCAARSHQPVAGPGLFVPDRRRATSWSWSWEALGCDPDPGVEETCPRHQHLLRGRGRRGGRGGQRRLAARSP